MKERSAPAKFSYGFQNHQFVAERLGPVTARNTALGNGQNIFDVTGPMNKTQNQRNLERSSGGAPTSCFAMRPSISFRS